MNFIFPYIGNNKANWRTHIFQRGGSTTNQWSFRCSLKPFDFLSPLAANFVQHHTFGNWSRARARQKEVSMFVEAFWSWKTPGILGTFYNALREERKCRLELEMSQSWGRLGTAAQRHSPSTLNFSFTLSVFKMFFFISHRIHGAAIYILWCAMDPINIFMLAYIPASWIRHGYSTAATASHSLRISELDGGPRWFNSCHTAILLTNRNP